MDENQEKITYYEEYYDPDIISILLNIISAVGSVCTTVGFSLEQIERKRFAIKEADAQQDNHKREESVVRKLRQVLDILDNQLYLIRRDLDTLRDIYHRTRLRFDSRNHQLEDNHNSKTMKFGNGMLLLNKPEMDDFHFIREQIEEHLSIIGSSLRRLENQLKVEYDKDLTSDIGGNADSRYYVREAVELVNRVLSGFGEISIDDFIEQTFWACERTQDVIQVLREHLNYENL